MGSRKSIGTGKDAPTTNGIDVLGWELSFGLRTKSPNWRARPRTLKWAFKRMPRDVMDKRAVAPGRHWTSSSWRRWRSKNEPSKAKVATLTLTDFVIPPDDVPEEVRSDTSHTGRNE